VVNVLDPQTVCRFGLTWGKDGSKLRLVNAGKPRCG
jgi:hypothetical protein